MLTNIVQWHKHFDIFFQIHSQAMSIGLFSLKIDNKFALLNILRNTSYRGNTYYKEQSIRAMNLCDYNIYVTAYVYFQQLII